MGSLPHSPWQPAAGSVLGLAKGSLSRWGQGRGWNLGRAPRGRAPWGRLLPFLWGHYLPVLRSGDGKLVKGGGAKSGCKPTFLHLSLLSPLSLPSIASPFLLQIGPETLEFRTETQKGGCLATAISPETSEHSLGLCKREKKHNSSRSPSIAWPH